MDTNMRICTLCSLKVQQGLYIRPLKQLVQNKGTKNNEAATKGYLQ